MSSTELSGCAIIQDNKLLLLKKIKHSHFEFPGGKVEPKESIKETAVREVKEEIGCTPKISYYLGYIDFSVNNKHFRSHKFLATLPKNSSPKICEKEKFSELLWLDISNYKKYPLAPNAILFCELWLSSQNK